MKAEIIIIGNEILKGKVQDTNSAFMARELAQFDITLEKITTTADKIDSLSQIINEATNRADLILLSGGLGPTQDDITKHALAQAFNLNIQQNKTAQKIAEQNYKRYQKRWDPQSNYYHHFIDGAIPLNNPQGLAPGIFLPTPKLIFAMPGVPKELKAMFTQEVLPILQQEKTLSARWEEFTIRTSGIAEEKIFSQLMPNLWQDLQQWCSKEHISSLPSSTGVTISLNLDSQKEDLSKQKAEIKEFFSSSPLAPYIWHYGNEEINQLVVNKLIETNKTLSTAESCTGGLIASLITDISGSSAAFVGGFVTYSNEHKINQINVSEKTLASVGAVSQEVAIEMAQGTKIVAQSDYALSITGIAGPGGATPTKPVGTAHMAITNGTQTQHHLLHFHGSRNEIKKQFALAALINFYKFLTKE